MKYAEWQETVSIEIRKDPIWKLEVYGLALFAGDIGWSDVLAISKQPLMYSIADQLHRSLGSISANLTEGYSRSKGLDRARFIEIALGSARESRDWYYKARHALKEEVVSHRVGLTTHIVGMLTPIIPHQRKNALRGEKAEYLTTQPSTFSFDSEVPMP